jgi:hypothetical protein
MFLSRSGLELRQIWEKQQASLAESDDALRNLEREADSTGEHSRFVAASARAGKPLPARHQISGLDFHAQQKRASLAQAPEHEQKAVEAALPHLHSSIASWTKARHLETQHGAAIQDEKHPAHEEAVKLRQTAYGDLSKAKRAAGAALTASGQVRRHQSTGSWQQDAGHQGTLDRHATKLLNQHTADLMAGHDPEHKRQYLARMNGATTDGNTWHWGYGVKHTEQPHWFDHKKGHETYHFDAHHDMARFQGLMHQHGHETSVTPGPVDPSTVDRGDPDSHGDPMHYELHVKTGD